MFIKEISILKYLKCKNIVRVEGYSKSPAAVMLDYVFFDFQPLRIECNRVTNLTDFLDLIVVGNM